MTIPLRAKLQTPSIPVPFIEQARPALELAGRWGWRRRQPGSWFAFTLHYGVRGQLVVCNKLQLENSVPERWDLLVAALDGFSSPLKTWSQTTAK
jgi:hypothetical protein